MGQGDYFSPDIVQNVGDIKIYFAHAKLFNGGSGGQKMLLGGFRLQGEIMSLQQLVDNSVLVPLLGGGSVQLTNSNQSGQITFNSIRTSMLMGGFPAAIDINGVPTELGKVGEYDPDGLYDMVSVADYLRSINGGDSTGGTFKIESTFNGSTFVIYLKKATLVRSPPFLASGNDAPNYQTIFNYSRPVIADGSVDSEHMTNVLLDEANGLG
jgi:hypothetical protein